MFFNVFYSHIHVFYNYELNPASKAQGAKVLAVCFIKIIACLGNGSFGPSIKQKRICELDTVK